MARPLGPVGQLGGRVAATIASYRESRESERMAVRVRLLASASNPALVRGRFQSVSTWQFGYAAVAVFGLFGMWHFHQRPLAFTAGNSPGLVQAWIAAPEGNSMPLQFADGSAFQISPKSRVRVVDTSRDGARLAIERGEIHAEVVHRPHGSWWIIAGPYSVHVTGTVFDVKWDPANEQFAIAVSNGSITVTGPIAGSARPVAAGYRLVADLPQSRLEVMTIESSPRREVASGAAEPFAGRQGSDAGLDAGDTEGGATTSGRIHPESSGQGGVKDRVPREDNRNSTRENADSLQQISEWQQLAKAGKLKQAFASAEKLGFATVCETADPSDLLILGDAARLAGRPERATSALLALRRRFPNDSRRAASAFALGKVAFDQRRAYAEAAKWFALSLKEQPRGSLAQEASGRLVEAWRNSGDARRAKDAARIYLSQYPDGPHARLARTLLED